MTGSEPTSIATKSRLVRDSAILKFTLFGIVILAYMLRGWGLHDRGFTADEVSEVRSAHAPLSSIILDEDDDRFPPLYRVALATTIRLTGTDLAARWLNVLFGVVAVAVAWRAGVELLGPRAGIWPALLLATCPLHVHFSREGRAYPMYFLLCSLAIWAMLRLRRTGDFADWLFLGVASVLAIYTHYFALPLLTVLWISALLVAWGRKDFRLGLAVMLGAGVACLPTVFLYWQASQDLPGEKLVASFDIEAWAYTFMSLVSGFTLGPSMRELRTMSAAEGIRQFLPWVVPIGIVLLTLSVHALVQLRKPGLLALFAALLIVLPPVIGWGGDFAGVGFVYRYVIWLALPFVLWLGAGAARCGESKTALVAVAVLLLIHGIALKNQFFNPRYQGEDFRAVAQYLEASETRRPILVASPYMAAALDYYLDDDWKVSSFPIFAELEEQRQNEIRNFRESLSEGSEYWYVSQWLPDDDVRRTVRDRASETLAVQFTTEVAMMEISTGVR